MSDLLTKSAGSPPHLMRLLGSRLDAEMDMLEDFAQSIAMVYYNLKSVTPPSQLRVGESVGGARVALQSSEGQSKSGWSVKWPSCST